ncbi:unnamed protein product [Pleuronectes platessa]|uniref:Uncharacterized protein n=1 Tax=Pleuronectes platessa TaxID=8262 RepID=A0A9N7ULN5_PLEPL|nr:unnamed protein product [Pleuronectes platessa]
MTTRGEQEETGCGGELRISCIQRFSCDVILNVQARGGAWDEGRSLQLVWMEQEVGCGFVAGSGSGGRAVHTRVLFKHNHFSIDQYSGQSETKDFISHVLLTSRPPGPSSCGTTSCHRSVTAVHHGRSSERVGEAGSLHHGGRVPSSTSLPGNISFIDSCFRISAGLYNAASFLLRVVSVCECVMCTRAGACTCAAHVWDTTEFAPMTPARLELGTGSVKWVAIIAGNFELAELIKDHKETDIVPFREAPAYSKRHRGPASGSSGGNSSSPSSLSAPRVLLRSNSDNNLSVSQYQQQQQQQPGSPGGWAPHLQQHHPHRAPQQGQSQPGSSALHRSLSPQLLQQMPSGSPNGNVVVRTMGRGARSRSPSLSRLGEESRRAMASQRQPRVRGQGSEVRGELWVLTFCVFTLIYSHQVI